MSGKIKSVVFLLSLLLTTQLSGCLTAGLGPQFTRPAEPEAGKAIIYVYRERVAMTGHEVPGVKMNDGVVVKTLPEVSYFPIAVEPGRYTFSPKLFGIYKTTPATVDARPGQVYYVKFRLTIGHLQFTPVDKDEAMAYMATCYLLNPGFAVDGRVMVDDRQTGSSAVEPKIAEAPATPVKVEPAVRVAEPVRTVAEPVLAELYVEPTPAAARIRIMNIKPKFHQGIRLSGGRYHIEVSAPGYKKYLEWITVKKGETKRLKVDLESVVAKTPSKRPAAPKTVAPKAQVVVKAPDGASVEEKRYAGMLQGGSAVDIRNAAKNIYYRYPTSNYLASAAEQCLLQNYHINSRDNMHVDAMAWLCKALARTGNTRFSETLQLVAENAPSRKLRSYAQKSLGQL